MAEFGDMTGWKLGEKKTIKAKASEYTAAVSAIQAKLGSGWTVNIDFPSWATNSEHASSSYRKDPGKYIVVEILGAFVSSDLNKMDQDTADTLNKLCPTQTMTYKLGPKTGSYQISNRLNISVDASAGLVMEWSGDYYSYSHNSPYLCEYIDSLPGVAANPPYPGNWTLEQLKALTASKSAFDAAEKAVQAKLGADWKIECDWASVAEHSATASSSYVKKPGKYWIEEVIQGFAKDDLAKFDEDVSEAMNELCGGAHVIKFALGPKTGSYAISNRLNIEMDESAGATFTWSGDYFSYSWNSDYANQYVLSNA